MFFYFLDKFLKYVFLLVSSKIWAIWGRWNSSIFILHIFLIHTWVVIFVAIFLTPCKIIFPGASFSKQLVLNIKILQRENHSTRVKELTPSRRTCEILCCCVCHSRLSTLRMNAADELKIFFNVSSRVMYVYSPFLYREWKIISRILPREAIARNKRHIQI